MTGKWNWKRGELLDTGTHADVYLTFLGSKPTNFVWMETFNQAKVDYLRYLGLVSDAAYNRQTEGHVLIIPRLYELDDFDFDLVWGEVDKEEAIIDTARDGVTFWHRDTESMVKVLKALYDNRLEFGILSPLYEFMWHTLKKRPTLQVGRDHGYSNYLKDAKGVIYPYDAYMLYYAA